MSMASMGGLAYDVVVPPLRRQVPSSLETQARGTVATIARSTPKRPKLYRPMPTPRIRKVGRL